MLASPVFTIENRNETFLFTNTDARLCLSIAFLASVSTNAIMLTAVAIALHSYVSIRLPQYGNRLITCFVSISWVACLVFGGTATWQFFQYSSSPTADMDLETFSIVVVYGCVNSDSVPLKYYPNIVTTVNAVFTRHCHIHLSMAYDKEEEL